MSFLQLRSKHNQLGLLSLPTVITTAATGVVDVSAQGNGIVVNAGGSPVTVRGFVWSSSNSMPTLADSSTTAGSGTGVYSGTLSPLSITTFYYYRAYATNSIGTAYGEVFTFTTTAAVVPVVNTLRLLMLMGVGT